jgi:hypothetical protein
MHGRRQVVRNDPTIYVTNTRLQTDIVPEASLGCLDKAVCNSTQYTSIV